MIPAGVFNQGSAANIYFFNFNGSGVEAANPSTPLGLPNETELLYTTTGGSFAISDNPSNLPISEDVFTLTPEKTSWIDNSNALYQVNYFGSASNSRLYRGVTTGIVSGTKALHFILDVPNGTKFKIHFWAGLPSGTSYNKGTFRFEIYDIDTEGEGAFWFQEMDSSSIVGNPFLLDPYAEGSGWVTSDEITKNYGGNTLIGVQNYQSFGAWGFYWSLMGIEILNGGTPPPPPVLTSITVNPSTFSVSTGSTRQLVVTANYSNGSTVDVTNDATYSSSNSSVASVNSTGLVSGVSTGSATINISYEGETTSSSATVTVPATLTGISVSPTSASIQVGQGRQLTVTAHYSDSSTANVTSLASYTRTNTRISVNSTGYVTAISEGASGVDISYEGHTTSMSVTVTVPTVTGISISPSSINMSVGSTRQLTVTAHYSDSSTADVTSSASYGTSDSSRATVSSTGLVTAGSSPGSVNITATYGGWSDGINVNVTAATVTSLSISPTSFSIAQGKTQQLAVTAHMSDSSTQNVTESASYSSSNTGRATVNSSGLVTASNSNTGAVNITASYQGYSATSSGTITAATVESITVSPTSVSLPMGRTQQLTVTAHLSNGGTQTVTSSASYSSNNTGRATVSSSGLITAGNTTGAATITITYSGKSTTMTSTTTAAVVDNLSVSPATFSVEVGSTQQLTVTAAMSNGTNQNVTSSATYTRTNSNITVSSSGLVTGSSAGSSGVNISYGGKSTSASITVTQAVKTIVELQVIDLNGGYLLAEIQLNSNTPEVSFFIRARYNDNSTRDLEGWEYQITDPSDQYIKFDALSLTPRVYYEGWNVPPINYSITTSINYTGSEPTNVETQPLTVRYV